MSFKQYGINLYRRIKCSGFLKSVLTLSSGAVVAQGINFLGMPIVSRIYTPAAMGDYTLITSNATIIMSVACLGMMTSFMLPQRHEEARGLSRLVTYSTLLLTTLAVLGVWLVRDFYRIFSTEETPYALALGVLWLYIVSYTVSNICYAYVNRHKLYKVMFWNPVLTAGINVVLGAAFGLLGWGFVGYTASHILAFLVNIFHLMRHANPYAAIRDPAYRSVPLLKSYRRFPLYQMPANLIASVGSQIPLQVMERLYSSGALGMYSMALKILSIPIALLATPTNRVYFREASERYQRGENIGEFSFKILKTNIRLAIVPIFLLIIFGEWIFAFFLGEQWREAGLYAAVLGIYQLMLFCFSCLSGCFVIIGRNRINLLDAVFNVGVNGLLAAVCMICVPSILTAVFLFSLAGIVKILVFQGVFLYLTRFRLSIYYRFVVCYILLPVFAAWAIRILIF